LLWYNEGVAIKTHRSLNEANDAFVKLHSATDINPDFDGRLVHASHQLSVDTPVSDSEFGLSRPSISLRRSVETFQWVEHKKTKETKLQNGETRVETTYSYTREWKEGNTDSGSFQHSHGRRGEQHYNPASIVSYRSQSWTASGVKLGLFTLGQSLVSQLTQYTPVTLQGEVRVPTGGELSGGYIYFQGESRGHVGRDYDAADTRRRQDTRQPQLSHNAEDGIESKIQRMDGEDRILYTVKHTGETFTNRQRALDAAQHAIAAASREPARRLLSVRNPEVGDVRVSFSEVRCRVVSVLARQSGYDLVPWKSAQGQGYDIAMVQTGSESPEDMISGAQSSNDIWTWVKRIFGWLLCFFGFHMFTSIISTTADITLNWIPFLGPLATSIINLGLCIANFVLSISLSFVVAAIAWVFYRPVLGITMLACSAALLFVASKAGDQKGPSQGKALD